MKAYFPDDLYCVVFIQADGKQSFEKYVFVNIHWFD